MADGAPLVEVALFDCDGVLQHPNGGWVERLDAFGGAGFAVRVFAAEEPAMIGERPFADALEDVARDAPVPVTATELLRMWEDFWVDDEAWAVVDELRRAGVTTGLATNQQDHRAAHMREARGYAGRTDLEFYSCDMGAAKPDPAFFAHVIDACGVDPASVLFVDDRLDNVEAAGAAGLRAVLHEASAGARALRALVAAHVPVLTPADGATGREAAGPVRGAYEIG